jgi:hypothetical protein
MLDLDATTWNSLKKTLHIIFGIRKLQKHPKTSFMNSNVHVMPFSSLLLSMAKALESLLLFRMRKLLVWLDIGISEFPYSSEINLLRKEGR